MSDFIVHTIPGSPFARSVMAALEEKGAPWRVAAMAPGTLKVEPHISRHPFGRMPAVEHGDFMLYETQAILRYIDRVIQEPALTPADPRAAARMDQVMNISDWYLFQGVASVIGFQRVVGPALFGITPDEEACAAAMPKAHQVFGELSRLLGDQPYLAGESLTLADLMTAPQVDFLTGAPEWRPLTEGRANLVEWIERMNARASMQATNWPRVTELAKAAA